MSADSLRKGFVKGDGKNLVVKDDERGDYGERERDTKPDFARCERENRVRAEKRGADIARKIVRRLENIHDEVAESQRSHRNHRDGGISLNFGIFPGAEEQNRGNHRDWQDEVHIVREV